MGGVDIAPIIDLAMAVWGGFAVFDEDGRVPWLWAIGTFIVIPGE